MWSEGRVQFAKLSGHEAPNEEECYFKRPKHERFDGLVLGNRASGL